MHESGRPPATYLIGRSGEADIVLGDTSVSRRHAELVAGRDGMWFLTDRASSGGTCRLEAGGWAAIRQAFVHPGERLRFGGFECTLDDLLRMLPPESVTECEATASSPVAALEPLAHDPAGDEPGPGTPVSDDRPAGAVRRDPDTGEILSMGGE